MLNYLWGFMILAGILWGAANNSLDAVTQGLLDSAGEAVKLCITMAGVMSFWCGILEVGNRSGLIEWLADKMEPILTFLFPDLGKDHPARLPISVNMAANMLGLGMAATPAGLEAMKLMQEGKQSKATNAMCTFLIINISSLQLVPVTMIAYRSQYGSSDPTAVLGPALIATGCSTLAAVIFCKLMDLGKAVKKK
jgi:spore maturation protein A